MQRKGVRQITSKHKRNKKLIYTIKIITDHARAAAAKVAAGEALTEEDKTFVTNVLLDYAKRLETRSTAVDHKNKATEPHLVSNAQYVLSRRIEKIYKTLLGQPLEAKQAGRKKKIKE